MSKWLKIEHLKILAVILCVSIFVLDLYGGYFSDVFDKAVKIDGFLGLVVIIPMILFWFMWLAGIFISFATVFSILGFIFSCIKRLVGRGDSKIENSIDIYTKVSSSVHDAEILQPTKTLDTQSIPVTTERESIPIPSSIKQSITTASNFSVEEQKVSTGDEKQRLPVPRKVDWDSVQKARKQTGDFGEMLVIEYEKAILLKSGESDLSTKVELVASRNLGYDVLSKFSDGSNKYIEVKAFAGSKAHNFVVTRNELDFLKENPDSSYVYMVINCDTEPEILMTSARQFFKLNLKPSVFKITL
jgi:hypothetical protein